MSAQQAAQVYSRIIDQVCEASQTDFEEGGVDSDTLGLLKQRWQKKLSALEVGHFPWDPQPANATSGTNPSPALPPQNSLSSKAANVQQQQQQQEAITVNRQPSPAPSASAAPPGIKVEAQPYQAQPYQANGLSPAPPSLAPQPAQQASGTSSSVAQGRAVQQFHEFFGPRAAVQVNQLQQSSRQREQTATPKAEDRDAESQKPQAPAFSPSILPARAPLQTAQQDGAGESSAEWVCEDLYNDIDRPIETSITRGRLFRCLMLHRQQQIEAGGLMLPLEKNSRRRQQQYKQQHHLSLPAGPKRRADTPVEQQPSWPLSMLITDISTPPGDSFLGHFQGDGQAEEENEEEDENAINSDLDDPKDGGGYPEDDSIEDVMLCTYEKVNRTKNKRKCLLKDGIFRVNNKEYVFAKGTGEFEW